MMTRLIILLLCTSHVLGAQQRVIIKDYNISGRDINSRSLDNLEAEASDIVYRIWIEPDLVIEVGSTVTLTLYITGYDRKMNNVTIENVKKIKLDYDSKILLTHFDSLKLNQWRDSKNYKGNEMVTQIHDGHRLLIEYSTKDNYRSFSLYGPLTDKSFNSRKTLYLINFIADSINPDFIRTEYYRQLAGTSKKAKRRLQDIREYKYFLKEEIQKEIFPKMWGDY